MEYITILALGVLATAKMSFQSGFSKTGVKNSTDALCFNIFVFITSAVLFLPKIFGCSPAVWVYASIGAAFTVAFQLFYTKALSIGNVSLTVLIVNFQMVITVLVSYLCFNEPISPMRLVAIGLTIVSFIVCNATKKTKGTEGKWLLFTVLAMITTSAGSVVQKFFGESAYGTETQAFVSCLYIVATVIASVVYLILNKKEKRTFNIGFGMIKYAAAVGISLAVFQILYTHSMTTIDGTFLFPAYTGVTIICSTLSGVLIFKDRFTKQQIIGVVLGMISLVLMNY